MSKTTTLILLTLVISITGCKTIDYSKVRSRAMQGQAEDIGIIQSSYLKISPSSRLPYMRDLATLNRRFPTTFQAELAKQKPRTQEAVGYLLNAEATHQSLINRINKVHGSNNSP